MQSAFNYAVAVSPTHIGLGLEMYLGADYSYYAALQIPAYRRRTMHSSHIAPDVIKAWVATEFVSDSLSRNLLGELMAEGRILHACKRLMPHIPDTAIFGFSAAQLEWCKSNEAQMWGFLIEKKLLFTTQQGAFRKLLSEGPFTPGFDRNAPAKAITWLGYRMVEEYLKKNPDTSLPELMEYADGQKFLQQSGYRPTNN
jgi:hypothetical protein